MTTHIQQSGYQSQSRLSPAAIGGVLLVHAGLGAVILTLSAVQQIVLPEAILWTRNIPKDQPKPQDKPQPHKTDPRSAHATTATTQPDKRPVTTVDPTTAILPGITDPVGGTGTGPVIEPVLPPADLPQPVLVQSRLDTRFAAGFQPPYPAAMLRQQMEGNVTVRVTIGLDGRVTDVALVSAADPAFYEATRRQALARWRFIPGTRDGVAITTEKVMTVHFHLTD